MSKLHCLLDTNICIYLMQEQPESVVQKFARHQKGEIAISAVTWAELCCGLDRHNSRDELLFLLDRLVLLDFDQVAAEVFGELHRRFPQKKGSFDRMIAAQAIACDLALITNNVADFALYQAAGLRVENWLTQAD